MIYSYLHYIELVLQNSEIATISSFKTQQIDVRTIALQSFRDQIILPARPLLHDRLTSMHEQRHGSLYRPKLQQM